MSAIPLKTGIPAIVDSNLLDSNSLDAQYIDFLNLARQYDSIKYKNDPITAEVDFWENLSNANPVDIADIDSSGEFVAWWLDKYRKTHPKVKELLEERLPNIEDTILQTISESVGLLFSQYLTPHRRDMHYADEFDPTPDGPTDSTHTPFPYNNVIDDKLDFDTRKNILGLSKRTEAIFGRNMQQVIYGGDGQPNLAHGTNLVTDYIHLQRLGEIHSDIMIEVGRLLGGTYKVLYWLTCNKIANKQEAIPVVHTLQVENTEQEVDDLMNAIQDSWRAFTMNDIRS
tara:strand:+ start:3918 stop:4772 length:855 start_codon:yes stop_codon:yes gene_type:complete